MIEITLDGNFTASCPAYNLSVTRKKHGVVDVLCRQLLDAGAKTSDQVRITRNGTVCFNPSTVGFWAERRLHEHDEHGFRVNKFQADWWKTNG